MNPRIVLICDDTASAGRALAALEALTYVRKYGAGEAHFATVPNVEIFAPGTWNGDKFELKDLQDMVEAFAKQDFKPAVKLGHTEAPGTPAYGYVDHLRMVGDKMVGDLVDVPDELVKQIQEKRFNRVSAEIFFNLKRGAEVFRRALKAVALLGAEVPAVAGLRPLSASFANVEGDVKFFDLPINQPHEKETEMDQKEIQAAIKAALAENNSTLQAEFAKKLDSVTAAHATQVAELSKSFGTKLETITAAQRNAAVEAVVAECRIPALRHSLRVFASLASDQPAEKKYALGEAGKDGKAPEGDALEAVRTLIKELNAKGAKLFLAHSKGDDKTKDFEKTGADDAPIDTKTTTLAEVSAEVDKRTKAYMAEKNVKDYAAALKAVLDQPENAELKAAYTAPAREFAA